MDTYLKINMTMACQADMCFLKGCCHYLLVAKLIITTQYFERPLSQ
jgi:hypothetical protein